MSVTKTKDENNVQADWVRDVVADLPALATSDETAAALRMSRRNLRRLVVAGRIRARRHVEAGASPALFPRAEIERYLRSLDGAA
ncbi:MAG TPA: helix-turn-helix domain-containing protein [Polyangiaceae bacterium]|jgi:hypothetical protein